MCVFCALYVFQVCVLCVETYSMRACVCMRTRIDNTVTRSIAHWFYFILFYFILFYVFFLLIQFIFMFILIYVCVCNMQCNGVPRTFVIYSMNAGLLYCIPVILLF